MNDCAFEDIESFVLDFIDKSDVVVGCVAWLSNYRILQALARKRVSIVVDDPLRHSLSDGKATFLKKSYARMSRMNKFWFHPHLFNYDVDGPVYYAAVRMREMPAFNLMHHKFLVRCAWAPACAPFYVQPSAVLTGSYNFTLAARSNEENVVVVTDLDIVQRFYAEWERQFRGSTNIKWEEP
jgi:phosphatidylserine/phosphatidylglycerophosphate/cardiolipin synthase-like enzyme